jgi:hypothetical protein
MSEDLDALLREHYRRAAETIVPDTELVERGRAAGRTYTSPVRTWPRLVAAAAVIAAIAAVTWGLLRPAHRSEQPATPPVPMVDVTPRPTPTPVPWPSPSRQIRPAHSPPDPVRVPPRRRTPAPRRSIP